MSGQRSLPSGTDWQPAPGRVTMVGHHSSNEVDGVKVGSYFDRIVKLRVGETLLFAPNAAVSLGPEEGQMENDAGIPGSTTGLSVKGLGHGVFKILVRHRITTDGGGAIIVT